MQFLQIECISNLKINKNNNNCHQETIDENRVEPKILYCSIDGTSSLSLSFWSSNYFSYEIPLEFQAISFL